MIYDDAGKNMDENLSGNARFIELNFRKRPANELQEKFCSANDDSLTIKDSHIKYAQNNLEFKDKNEVRDNNQNESDYVTKLIEHAAGFSGMVVVNNPDEIGRRNATIDKNKSSYK